MRFVDHDPSLARLAAARCREAAQDHRATAVWLELYPRCVDWRGCARESAVLELERIAAELRAEAAALDASAERLETSAWLALRAEAAATAGHERRRRAAAACTSANEAPSWGPAVGVS